MTRRRDMLALVPALGKLALGAVIGTSLATAMPQRTAAAADPIMVGVSGPLTGPNAQYGAQWKAGFDLALDEINGAGGINGRPLAYNFQDSQSDPKQSVAIAQKFVSDKSIVMEIGDFSSPASMAASPVYQRAGLVQLGFTNSHPDFTKGGTYMWSNSLSQNEEQPQLAKYGVEGLGFKKVAVLYQNTDWGRTSKEILVKTIKDLGAEVVIAEGYQPEEKDFRSTLVRVRDANPDGIILISYYADAALIGRQLKTTGVTQPVVGVGSMYSPKLLELGGDAVEGFHTYSNFFPSEPRPEVQKFVSEFRKKYDREPDAFAARAYDTMILAAEVIKVAGTDRTKIRDTMATIKDVPSVIYGKMTFDPESRRALNAQNVRLVVKDGQFAVWDGNKTN